MKNLKLLFALFFGLLLMGCPQYETVRKVSTEQLNVQTAFQGNLTKYLKSTEQAAENHIIVAKLYYDDLLEADEKRIRAKAIRDLSQIRAADTQTREERSEQLGRELEKLRADNEKDKKDLDDTLIALKAKHKEMLAAYQTIIDAQTQLNEYIQLKKADEVAVTQLLGKMRINQQKLLGFFDEAADIMDKMTTKKS